jgi:hypothetical protein
MASRFKPSYSGVGQMLRSGFLQADMHARAERVAAAAIASAPFDPKDPDGVHYKDSFEVESGVRRIKTARAYGRVRNTDEETAVAVEFGNKNTPEHATLRKALSAAG